MDAKNAVKAQFMKEYACRDYADISVKGLCAAAPVARTTFYSHFNNTDDVKAEIEDDLISGLIAVSERVSGGNYPDMDFIMFMDETERFIRDHWSDIYAFLVLQPNLRFIRKWKDAIIRNFGKRYPEKKQAKSYEALAEILASSVISAYTYWMEHPDNGSTAEIKPILRHVLDSLVTFL